MTTVLALDATSRACSAAVWCCTDDHQANAYVIGRYEIAPREHTRKLLPMAYEVLHDAGLKLADVDAIAYGRGPGAFTGIRIAAGSAQGLALGLGCPVVAVSSLKALALGAADASGADVQMALGALDARMGEVYVGAYRIDRRQPQLPVVEMLIAEQVCAPEAMRVPEALPETIAAAGAGLAFMAQYPPALRKALVIKKEAIDAEPDAACIARLAAHAYLQGKAVAPEVAQPVYLRDNVVKRSTQGPLD